MVAVGAVIVLIAALLIWRITQKTPDEGDGPAPSALVSVTPARA